MSQYKPTTTECAFVEDGGYVRLAEHMGRHPQLAILRRFGTLANETLLYYQAEITELEHRLKCIQGLDHQSDDENRKQYAQSWTLLSGSAAFEESDSPPREQYKLIMKLRKLMVEYRMHLSLFCLLFSMLAPYRADRPSRFPTALI
jgi:hypothetical protein